MAVPAADMQDQPVKVGEKRKRGASDIDAKDDYQQAESDATVEPKSMISDNSEYSNDDDDDDDDENVLEEYFEIPTYDDSAEPFPKCAMYDDATTEIEEKIVAIPPHVLSRLQEIGHLSQSLKSHISNAEALRDLPQTPKPRIAAVECAGTGKSGLANTITGKADLAKSLSGGQSCTCVPIEYHDALPGQTAEGAASLHYFKPDGVKRQLRETLKDYYTFAFEAEDEWDEDTRMSAEKAYANAFRVLRTLFNDSPGFQSKNATVGHMSAMYTRQDSLMDQLVIDCEMKPKDTVKNDYATHHKAKTLAKLRNKIDPLMNSNDIFDKPSLWPLLQHVKISVRGSRVLEKVVLIDLPGISDTD